MTALGRTMLPRDRRASIHQPSFVLLLLSSLAAGTVVTAQQPPAPLAAEPSRNVSSIRVTTHFVEVNVIVNDKHGNPITGLTKDNFVLLDNKRPQEIHIATQFFKNSMFAITKDKIVAFTTDTGIAFQSSARFASLQDAQQSLLSQIAKPQSAPGADAKQLPLDSLLVPMQYYVPKRSPPSCRSATHEGGRWRLQLAWPAGPLKEATLFLDDSFNAVNADLTYATSTAKNGSTVSWPLLWDAMRNQKADQLDPPPQSDLTIIDKSSSIHAFKNGRPLEVQARLIDIHRTGKMLAVYDPTSRLFWCIYEPHGLGDNIGYYSRQFEKGNSRLLVTDEKILGFDAVSNNSFTGVQESTLRYTSFSEGLNYALTAIRRNVGLIRDGHVCFDLRLPPAFLTQRMAPYNVAPRYLGISESHHDWQVVLEGASGQQAVVTLGEKYEPVRASITYAAHSVGETSP